MPGVADHINQDTCQGDKAKDKGGLLRFGFPHVVDVLQLNSNSSVKRNKKVVAKCCWNMSQLLPFHNFPNSTGNTIMLKAKKIKRTRS